MKRWIVVVMLVVAVAVVAKAEMVDWLLGASTVEILD